MDNVRTLPALKCSWSPIFWLVSTTTVKIECDREDPSFYSDMIELGSHNNISTKSFTMPSLIRTTYHERGPNGSVLEASIHHSTTANPR